MRGYRRFLPGVMIVILITGFSYSQDKLVLTLDESIRLALSQNPYHLASEERVASAEYGMLEAKSKFFPSLSTQGLHTLDEKVFELDLPSFFPGQPPQRVKMDFTRDYQISLSLTFPLYMGGKIVSGLRQAKYNLQSARETVRQSEEEMVFNVKRAFYGYLLGKEFAEVAEEAVKLAEKHYENVKRLYEAGLASKFDLLRSEVQLANLQPRLIKARNALKLSELSLKSLLGLELSRPVEIRGKLIYEPLEAEEEKCLEKALLNRPELKQLDYQKKIAREMLKLARASHLPSVAISGTYNLWADKFSLRRDNWQSFYAINLALSLPVFNGFSISARVGQSRALIRELELTHKGLVEAIKLEVRQALLSLKEARESIVSQGKNVEQARESVRIAELNYAEGLATSLDVSSARVALTEAKSNYAQALYDYAISLARLEKAMGVGWKK
ncbi:MAG: TolC family protein [Candidatus Aminicenantales bacterium]